MARPHTKKLLEEKKKAKKAEAASSEDESEEKEFSYSDLGSESDDEDVVGNPLSSLQEFDEQADRKFLEDLMMNDEDVAADLENDGDVFLIPLNEGWPRCTLRSSGGLRTPLCRRFCAQVRVTKAKTMGERDPRWKGRP